MLGVATRRFVILLLAVTAVLFAFKHSARALHPFQPVNISYYHENNSQFLLIDALTGLIDTTTLEFGTFTGSRYADGVLTFFDQYTDGSTGDVIASIEFDAYTYRIASNYDRQPITYVIVPQKSDSDTIDVYGVNTDTGEIILSESYPYNNLPSNAYSFDHYLYLGGQGDFTVIDLESGDLFTDEVDTGWLSSLTGNYWAYSKIVDDDAVTMLFDLDTFESQQLNLPDGEPAFAQVAWSPVDTVLLVRDADWQLWLYDVQSDTYTRLPENIRTTDLNSPFSHDGQHMIVVSSLDDETVSYSRYDLTTGDITPLFTQRKEGSLNTTRFYIVMWSDDQRELLVYRDEPGTTVTYRIFNVRNGNRMASREISLPDGGIYPAVTWD